MEIQDLVNLSVEEHEKEKAIEEIAESLKISEVLENNNFNIDKTIPNLTKAKDKNSNLIIIIDERTNTYYNEKNFNENGTLADFAKNHNKNLEKLISCYDIGIKTKELLKNANDISISEILKNNGFTIDKSIPDFTKAIDPRGENGLIIIIDERTNTYYDKNDFKQNGKITDFVKNTPRFDLEELLKNHIKAEMNQTSTKNTQIKQQEQTQVKEQSQAKEAQKAKPKGRGR